MYIKEGTPDFSHRTSVYLRSANPSEKETQLGNWDRLERPLVKMVSTQYPADDKISAHDAAQISEHHHAAKVGGLAANMSPERRAEVEKKLKRKLDARCSLFVLIYIMNCE